MNKRLSCISYVSIAKRYTPVNVFRVYLGTSQMFALVSLKNKSKRASVMVSFRNEICLY
ncbi:MAG: hypothetical protein ABH858_04915 [Candidatus Omnitrophota bacterium]